MSVFGWGARSAQSAATKVAPASREAVEPTSESGWQRLRDQSRPQDLVLSPLAKAWCDSLSHDHRPTQLCTLYPRVANRLALCWNDPALVSRVLDDLVLGRRRRRTGFPPAVSQELMRLRLLRSATAAPSGFVPLWDASGMAITDR